MRWSLANTQEASEWTLSLNATRRRWIDAAARGASDPLLTPEGPFCERYYRRRSEDKDTREFTLLAQSAPLLAVAGTVWLMRSKLLIIGAALTTFAGS